MFFISKKHTSKIKVTCNYMHHMYAVCILQSKYLCTCTVYFGSNITTVDFHSVASPLDFVKEARWSTNTPSDLPQTFKHDIFGLKLSFIKEQIQIF